jgi:hypothetical protein
MQVVSWFLILMVRNEPKLLKNPIGCIAFPAAFGCPATHPGMNSKHLLIFFA